MSIKTPQFVIIMILSVVCVLLGNGMLADEKSKVKPIPTESKNEKIRRAMSKKMTHTQNVFKGLVMNDMEMVSRAASSLKKISIEAPEDLEGNDIDNQLYDHFNLEFIRLTTQLEEMAIKKNPEGVAFVYQNLTANCMACHRYLSDLE